MWFLKNSAWLVVLVIGLVFIAENRNETVSAVHLAGRSFAQSPLAIVVPVAFLAGMFCAFVVTLFQHLRVHAALSRIRRENLELKRELSQLRNLPLEDLRLAEPAGTARG